MTTFRAFGSLSILIIYLGGISVCGADGETKKDKSNWPSWRGANRDGISQEKGLLEQWKGAPPIAWSTSGFGGGYSSVVIADGKIFTMGNVDDDCCIIAASLKDGKILWKTPIGNGTPNCTPTYDDGVIYGLSYEGELAACNAETGEKIWEKNFKRDFGGKMMSGWGYSESPLIDGDKLICTPGAADAMLVALNKKTGAMIWQTAAPDLGTRGQDGAGYASIVISNAGKVKQYVTIAGRGLISVAADDGRLLWNYNKIANGTANIPTPIVKGDYVFGSTGYDDGGSALIKVSAGRGGKLTATEVWYKASNQLQNHHGGVVLIGNHLFLGHGHNNGFPACVEFLTGKDVWRPGRGPGSGSAALAVAGDKLYFRYEDGTMALMDANPRKFALKGTFKIKTVHSQSWSHPVIFEGKLYLRDQNDLHCYDIKK
jgi:outer membrane protein assembly factor BamB